MASGVGGVFGRTSGGITICDGDEADGSELVTGVDGLGAAVRSVGDGEQEPTDRASVNAAAAKPGLLVRTIHPRVPGYMNKYGITHFPDISLS